jgi:hypothetical protein
MELIDQRSTFARERDKIVSLSINRISARLTYSIKGLVSRWQLQIILMLNRTFGTLRSPATTYRMRTPQNPYHDVGVFRWCLQLATSSLLRDRKTVSRVRTTVRHWNHPPSCRLDLDWRSTFLRLPA